MIAAACFPFCNGVQDKAAVTGMTAAFGIFQDHGIAQTRHGFAQSLSPFAFFSAFFICITILDFGKLGQEGNDIARRILITDTE